MRFSNMHKIDSSLQPSSFLSILIYHRTFKKKVLLLLEAAQLLKEPSACITSEQSGSKTARLHVAGDSALCAGRGS